MGGAESALFQHTKKAGRSGVLLSSKNTITQLDDQIADFADTAAIISHLDLVISVDTAIAHLAGALGSTAGYCCPSLRWIGAGCWNERTLPGIPALCGCLGRLKGRTGRW